MRTVILHNQWIKTLKEKRGMQRETVYQGYGC